MRYPIVNLGQRFIEVPVPKGLTDAQFSKICELVDVAMTSSSDRDKEDAADTIRSWMKGLWGDVSNLNSDKGKLKEYIRRYCPGGADFLVVWKPQFEKCPPGYLQTREGKCLPPIPSPPPLPGETLPPAGPRVPTRDVTPLEKRPIVTRPAVATPSTIAQILPPGVLDSFCQVVKAILEDPDLRAQEIYAAEFKKLVDRYSSLIAVIMEYLVRNCDPRAMHARDRVYTPVPPAGTPVPTPSRRPIPTVPIQQPVEMTPTQAVAPRPITPPAVEPAAEYQPVETPGAAPRRPYEITPTGGGGIPIPGTERAPVASTMCPPGQFWDGRQCRGSIAPGAAGLISAAGGLAPSGVTMAPGGLAPGGMAPTFKISGRYPVVNL
ncbi:MAG: hypothetical protein MN733_38465 [Nitrososphaera sp.]|nr:hypothetical protein [Nitrososphaera sp.]